MLRDLRGDGYGCLTASALEVRAAPLQGGVFFVDMNFREEAWDDVLGALRGLPPSVAGDASRVVFRSPVLRESGYDTPIVGAGPGWPSNVAEMADRLSTELNQSHPHVEVGAVELPVGGAPEFSANLNLDVLARCRAVELETFLHAGEAVWRPRKYHYQLPSGHHAATFVRIADAFRNPRAPLAIATWLYGCLSQETSVVVDSGTLMPIVQQLDFVLRLAAVARGEGPTRGLPSIEPLDAYPLSRFEFLKQFKALEQHDVLALLSVSSTGRTYRTLKQTLDETAGDRWRSECLVTRQDDAATGFPPNDSRGRQAPWLSLADRLSPTASADQCPHCRDVNTARVVHVDPRSFAAMTLPTPTRIMPDTDDGRRNATLLSAYKAHHRPGTFGVQLSSSETTRQSPSWRTKDPWRVRFEPTVLLSEPGNLSRLIRDRLNGLNSLPARDRSRPEIEQALRALQRGRPTLAVCDAEEMRVLTDTTRSAETAKRSMLSAAKEVCPSVESLAIVSHEPTSGEVLGGHTSVLLVTAGLLTGVTLQHLVVSVQDLFRRRGVSPEMHGIVLHAHPERRETWSSVRNSFRDDSGTTRLLSLWLTYLPQPSPFEEEYKVLSELRLDGVTNLRPGTAPLLQERLSWLNPDSAGHDLPASPLWSPTRIELRRTSLYGDLNDRHAFVAVGAAMQAALQRATSDGAPEWIQFDLPNALRSYFDGLIHVSILRWVTPQRAWWGHDRHDCVALIGELEGRFPDDWKFLLPELLLAAAQGKVPDEGVRFLLSQAETQLSASTWEDDVLDFVDLGRAIAENFRPLGE